MGILFEKNDQQIRTLQLNALHEPKNPIERARILSMGGDIRQNLKDSDKNEPLRIFESKSKDTPGLMMTRSFGDQLGKKCGVIATPSTKIIDISEKTYGILLASDGLWSVHTKEEIGNIMEISMQKGVDLQLSMEQVLTSCIIKWKEVIKLGLIYSHILTNIEMIFHFCAELLTL